LAFAIATRYGEGAAALACEMCDEMAELQGIYIAPTELAEAKSYEYVKAAVDADRKEEAKPVNERNEIDKSKTPRYTIPDKEVLRVNYEKSVEEGWISPLVSFAIYYNIEDTIYNELVGEKSAGGIENGKSFVAC